MLSKGQNGIEQGDSRQQNKLALDPPKDNMLREKNIKKKERNWHVCFHPIQVTTRAFVCVCVYVCVYRYKVKGWTPELL